MIRGKKTAKGTDVERQLQPPVQASRRETGNSIQESLGAQNVVLQKAVGPSRISLSRPAGLRAEANRQCREDLAPRPVCNTVSTVERGTGFIRVPQQEYRRWSRCSITRVLNPASCRKWIRQVKQDQECLSSGSRSGEDLKAAN